MWVGVAVATTVGQMSSMIDGEKNPNALCGSFEADGMEGKGRSESVDPVVHQVDVGRHRSIVPKT